MTEFSAKHHGSHAFARGQAPRPRLLRASALLAVGLAIAASGCASMPGSAAMQVGRDIAFTGTVASADFAPWAFDGSAVVRVDSPQGRIAIELPARYNLCKAQGIGGASTLAVGMKVDVNGRVTAPGKVSVCESVSHHIVRIP